MDTIDPENPWPRLLEDFASARAALDGHERQREEEHGAVMREALAAISVLERRVSKLRRRLDPPRKETSIRIGRFGLTCSGDGAVWLFLVAGPGRNEGGRFSEAELEETIAEFYRSRF